MIRFFKRIGPLTSLGLLLISLAVWYPSLQGGRSGRFLFDELPMPFYELLTNLIPKESFWSVALMFALALLMAVLLSRFNTSWFFINQRTGMPAIVYILLTGLFPVYQVLNPVLPASFFLLLALSRMIQSFKLRSAASHYFEAGLYLGVAGLFYANYLWFILFLWIGGNVLRYLSLRENLLALFGLAAPHILTAAYYYLMKDDLFLYISKLQHHLFGPLQLHYWDVSAIMAGISVLLLVLVSSAFMLRMFNTKKIRSRKIFSLFFWMALVSLLVFFISPTGSVELIYILMIPLSFLLAHYFVLNTRNILAESLFILLILGILVVVYFPVIG